VSPRQAPHETASSRTGIAEAEHGALRRLAASCRIETSYRDVNGEPRQASTEALLGVLRGLGYCLESPRDAPQVLEDVRAARRKRLLSPVLLAQPGQPGQKSAPGPYHRVQLPTGGDAAEFVVEVRLEDGETLSLPLPRLGPLEGRAPLAPALETAPGERDSRREPHREPSRSALPSSDRAGQKAGSRGSQLLSFEPFAALRAGGLPLGYHRCRLRGPGASAEALLIVAPKRCPAPPRGAWGLSAPLYSLRGRHDWGVGSYADLAELAEVVSARGGDLVGTLPLYTLFGGTLPGGAGSDPSPYLPVSKLAWNEVFIDIGLLPELADLPDASQLLEGRALSARLSELRALSRSDQVRVLAAKRPLLELGAEALFDEAGDRGRRRSALCCFLEANPDIEAYARFRAVAEQAGLAWRDEPRGAARELPEPRDRARYERAVRYYCYAQFVASGQLGRRAERGSCADREPSRAGLYLDLPVGSHRCGFDTWWFAESFASALSGGAPPDTFSPQGQSWGFPPLHPERQRESGYAYLRLTLERAFAVAAVLRIDHVMGLHRLYAVPDGLEARNGAYLSYPSEEIYAVLALESCRAGAVVVGEDLGTVPGVVRRSMAAHRVLSSEVVQFTSTVDEPLPVAPARSLASFGTHDLATFAGYWLGADIEDRERRKILGTAAAEAERAEREAWKAALWRALPRVRDALAEPGAGASPRECNRTRPRMTREVGVTMTGAVRTRPRPEEETMLEVLGDLEEHLGGGRAAIVLVDLADLCLETEPQNRPGTTEEEGNFSLRLQSPTAQILEQPEVRAILHRLARARAGRRARTGGVSS